MDERVREHAEVLVEWSARIEAGDDVLVDEGFESGCAGRVCFGVESGGCASHRGDASPETVVGSLGSELIVLPHE